MGCFCVLLKASKAASLLNSFSLAELRENAVGRALVKQDKARKMSRDEIVELLQPFAAGMTYDPPPISLHPFSPPSITFGEVSLLPRTLNICMKIVSQLCLTLSPACRKS